MDHFRKVCLNAGKPEGEVAAGELVPRLKQMMGALKAEFFDFERGRVAYERMAQSQLYQDYLHLSRHLQGLDLAALARREERIAFWINLYNVTVIHGIIALGLKDSVKEVWNFFRRVAYRVGGHLFTPDDMEHGILRGNRRPPYGLFRPFGEKDPRLRFIVEPLEPRIHFTLVCGASSCPFIDFYTAENLEAELQIAAAHFINTGGVAVDRLARRVSLSRIFKWYGRDFGATLAARLRFIATYLDDAENRRLLTDHPETLTVTYQPYDWRLNRG